MPRSRKFRVAAIFYSGMYEYDASHAYVLLDQAQRFFGLQGRITRSSPKQVRNLSGASDLAILAA